MDAKAEKRLPVREWQDAYRAGEFDSRDVYTQMAAGWGEWWCADSALAGRLKKIAPVVLGITDNAILDNYYVCFDNNSPLGGPMYDSVSFEPLSDERGDLSLHIHLDSPRETQKWVVYTNRNKEWKEPDFKCGNVREMCRYINKTAKELAVGLSEHSADPVHQESEYKQEPGPERKPRRRTPKKKGQER